MNYDHVVAIVIGLCSGVFGSLIAPWVNWGIEKKREKLRARRDLIFRARRFVSSGAFSCYGFSAEPYFMQLKPHLSENTINWIIHFEDHIECLDDTSTIHNDIKTTILEEITSLERRWRLI